MYKRIMVAVDGSDNSLRAVDQALMLAEAGGAGVEVDILSVINIDVYSDMVYDPILAHGDAQKEKIAPAVASFEAVGITPHVELLHGRPAEEIIRYVNNNAADLLVLGSRGLNALQEFAIGSVSHKVLKHAECPVLVVK